MTVWGQGFQLSPGDLVHVESPPGRGMVAAGLLFGLPLLGFFLGLYGAPFILPLLKCEPSEGYRLLTGGAGCLTSVGFVVLLYQLIGKGFFLMVVVEKRTDDPGVRCGAVDSGKDS